MTRSGSATRSKSRDRASLITIALLTSVLAGLHLADHVIRGREVVRHGLDPHFNHSGWPFQDDVTPFTLSLFAVTSILLGGIVLTIRHRVWARYWLVSAVLLGALVTQVHLVPGTHQESFSVIYRSWVDNPLMGTLAVVNTAAIIVSLIAMAANAARILRKG